MNHLAMIRELPCCACGQTPAGYAHHATGGSMLERVGVRGTRKHSDWLALPLCHDHHLGRYGIHTLGVRAWETYFRPQAMHLDNLGKQLNLDLWALAAAERDSKRANRKTKPSSKINAWRTA